MLAPSQTQATGALSSMRANAPLAASLVIAIVSALTIAGAWFFQLVIGLKPCPMCLEERWPYYIAIPLGTAVALAAWRKAPRAVITIGLLLIAAVMVWNVYMGVFHSGVEWKWWPGPQECTGTPSFGGAGGLADRLKSISLVRCDEAAWRFLGLSLAGYSALISAGLALVALAGVFTKKA